jgi:hypothetical protein
MYNHDVFVYVKLMLPYRIYMAPDRAQLILVYMVLHVLLGIQ